MGAGEVSKTRPGEEDYSGHKGDESKTHPGEDFEGGGDVEHKAMTAMAAIHDLASAAGVELDTNISGPSDVRPEEEVGAFTMESRRRLKRRLRSIVRENIRRRKVMKVSKRQLRRIIKEEKRNLQELEDGWDNASPDDIVDGYYNAINKMVYEEWAAAGIDPQRKS